MAATILQRQMLYLNIGYITKNIEMSYLILFIVGLNVPLILFRGYIIPLGLKALKL